jgi:hypothetical protein
MFSSRLVEISLHRHYPRYVDYIDKDAKCIVRAHVQSRPFNRFTTIRTRVHRRRYAFTAELSGHVLPMFR